ncbi:hypothetical protein JCM8202v2_004809 [Rhodotorula sphaerocarpa]
MSQPAPSAHRAPDNLSLLAAVTHSSGGMHPLVGVGHHPPLPPQGHTAGPDRFASSASQALPNRSALHNSSEPPVASGSAALPDPTLASGTLSRTARKSTHLEDRSEDGFGEDGRPRKKSRQALSCGECKRRKIKRGQPDDCCWDEAKIDPEAQPFALAAEVDELRARLHRVEAFLNKLPPSLQSSFEELGAKSLGPLASREWTPAEREMSPALLAAVIDKRGSIKDEAPADSLGVLDNFIFELASKPTGVAAAETDPELTAWRTSILAPRVVYSSPATGAVLGLDLCFSQAELDQCIKQVYDRVYSLLPTPEKMLRAIDRFFYRVHWVFSLLHRETFLAEFDRFQEMLRAGRRYSVDPAWLAILFNVLSLGCEELDTAPDDGSPNTDAIYAEVGTPLHAAAVRMYLLSDPGGREQFRTIQSVALFASWTILSGGSFPRFASWLAEAIRTGHKLGLHLMTTDPENMPPDDPALPSGKNSQKRETALKVWGSLVFFDRLGGTGRYRSYLIHPDQNSAPPPSNCNWSDLSIEDWRLSPAPNSVVTDATLERHKYEMARLAGRTFDLLITRKEQPFNYGVIRELDRQYQELLDSMPDAFRHESISLEAEDPSLRSKRYIALQGAHNRLVRLHRPFLVKGWEPNSPFAYSSEACVRSAKVVVVCHTNNLRLNLDLTCGLRMLYSHSLSAATVLAAAIFHAIDTDASEPELQSLRDNYQLVLDIFSEKVQSIVRSRLLRSIISAARHLLAILKPVLLFPAVSTESSSDAEPAASLEKLPVALLPRQSRHSLKYGLVFSDQTILVSC